MKKISTLICVLLVILTSLTGCVGDTTKEKGRFEEAQVDLVVSAASSLRDAVEELKAIYIQQHPQVNIIYNFGASGTLQKQIEEGAPADLFISAGKKQMDTLADKGLIIETSRQNLLENELVLIVQKDSPITAFADLAGPKIGKISIGNPESVPAGKYAQETLVALSLWDKIKEKLVLAKDVRQVLNYVETGNVDAGLVYRSDALVSKESKIVAMAPAATHKPILYPMAIIKGTKHQKAAEEFAAFLVSGEATSVFGKHGFISVKQ